MKQIALLESSREFYLVRQISSNSETVGVGTFFKASRFGCSKNDFDATSRESMKMDGRDSAKCQNWEKNGQNGHLEFVLNDNKTKVCIVLIFSN